VETSTLRWVLIIIGVVVIAAIFLFGNPEKKRKPKASRREEGPARKSRDRDRGRGAVRREPTIGATPDAEAAEAAGEGDQGELDIGAPKPQAPRKPAGPPPDQIISLFLLARDNHVITGAELLQATLSAGMDFGDMNIFHRLPEGSEKPVFSLANAAKPGHFERDEWNTFETSGVALFMALPGPINALDAWDSMLATARRIGEILNAELLDDERSPFTRQREAQIREQMRDYDRRKTRSR
jgi:cell division protein ZipA